MTKTPVFAGLDSDPVLLMLDNSQITNNECLRIARQALKQEFPVHKAALLLYGYCSVKARSDLRSVGDNEQATVLRESFNEVKAYYAGDEIASEEYWNGVARHYITKVQEGA